MMSEQKKEEFKKVVKPAVKWLQENGDPHKKIIIEMDGAELVSGEIGFFANVTEE